MSISKFEKEHFDHGFPWCDTCSKPAVFNEIQGILHVTKEFPWGVPEHLDQSGHEVTIREWYNS